MKMRYYLRGLGLGILVTAVFFLLGGNSGQTMSDEMIKERAKELGMVESTVLADIGESVQISEESSEETVIETTEDIAEETTEAVLETVSETETVTEEESTTVVEETVEEDTEEIASEEESTEVVSESTVPTGQMITIVVNSGEGSDTVSHRLHEAGLIDDPYEYDRYLMQNGYDKRIAAGAHEIPMGAEWQEIAVLLTKR